jgi:glutamate 5-kinase
MLSKAKRIVVKVGSALIADEGTGKVRAEWLATFAEDVARLKKSGKDVIIVTSGAVALGRHVLKLKSGALELEEKQAAAACGQIALAHAWRDAFAKHGLAAAQLLLTADDSAVRRRYLNARSTLDALLALSAVPVVNENDTVATAELKVGDNDRLSARVAEMTSADVLILLSDIDGLYSADPRANPKAEFIPEVKQITPEIEKMAGGAGSAQGTGGMATKLQAAKIALKAGCHMIIAKGGIEHPLAALEKGGRHTIFLAGESPLSARKQWISGMLQVAGALVVDEGAAKALQSGKSLLPAGVKAIEGIFARGDAVLIRSSSGRILGKGLAAYSNTDAARIIGRQSNEIETILGFKGRVALIHRDDMVLEQ